MTSQSIVEAVSKRFNVDVFAMTGDVPNRITVVFNNVDDRCTVEAVCDFLMAGVPAGVEMWARHHRGPWMEEWKVEWKVVKHVDLSAEDVKSFCEGVEAAFKDALDRKSNHRQAAVLPNFGHPMLYHKCQQEYSHYYPKVVHRHDEVLLPESGACNLIETRSNPRMEGRRRDFFDMWTTETAALGISASVSETLRDMTWAQMEPLWNLVDAVEPVTIKVDPKQAAETLKALTLIRGEPGILHWDTDLPQNYIVTDECVSPLQAGQSLHERLEELQKQFETGWAPDRVWFDGPAFLNISMDMGSHAESTINMPTVEEMASISTVQAEGFKLHRDEDETDQEWHDRTLMWLGNKIYQPLTFKGTCSTSADPVTVEGNLSTSPTKVLYPVSKRFACVGRGCPEREPVSSPQVCYTCGHAYWEIT